MEQENKKLNHVYVRGLLLSGFTILLLKLLITGDLKYYISPKLAPLIYFSVFAFLIMGIGQFLRNRKNDDEIDCDCSSDHGVSSSGKKSVLVYTMFIVPVITGMFFTNTALDSTFAANRTVRFGEKTQTITAENQRAAKQPNQTQESDDKYAKMEKKLYSSKKIIVHDDNYIFTMNTIEQNLDKFIGKEIEFVGFVFKPDGIKKNEIVVIRFGVTCCIADADVMGILSKGEVSNLRENQWVKVDGIIEKGSFQGNTVPSLKIKTIKVIPKLASPYVYFK